MSFLLGDMCHIIPKNEFYVTLMSDASKKEFKDNKTCDFKTQLAHPLELCDQAWQVGLVSLSLSKTPTIPFEDAVNIDNVKFTESEKARYIVETKFTLYTLGGVKIKDQTLSFGKNDIKRLNIMDGEKFMKEMINHFNNKVMTEVKVKTTTTPPVVDRFYE